jgi:3-oxoacyl-[acyl-carrier-protein] synthase II
MVTTHRALNRAGIEITPDLAPRVAVTFSSAVGGLDAVIHADRKMTATGKLPHPFVNPNSCINMVAGKVCILTGATGPITTSVTACATGNTSMIAGAMFLESGMADVAICGAVDFPLVEPIVAGFATMNGAYKTKPGRTDEPPEAVSRPFSINRRGFVVSEGAACIILATPAFTRAHGLEPHIELAGWGMTSDAHHFVAPHLDTVTRCMEKTIEHAGLKPGDIDAINAHAASTKVGDAVEVQALRQVFGAHVPPVSANKSMIGHAMGASSAIESVLAMEGLKRGAVLPTLNYRKDPAIELDCVPEGARAVHPEHVLKNAFGFGGCNACLVFRMVP